MITYTIIVFLNFDKYNNDQLEEYQELIMNKFKLREHMNILKLMNIDKDLSDKLY